MSRAPHKLVLAALCASALLAGCQRTGSPEQLQAEAAEHRGGVGPRGQPPGRVMCAAAAPSCSTR